MKNPKPIGGYCARKKKSACITSIPDFRMLVKVSKNKKTVLHHAHGDGGFAELKGSCDSDKVLYGVCQFKAGGALKLFYMCFVGEAVGGVAKASVGLLKESVARAFDGVRCNSADAKQSHMLTS